MNGALRHDMLQWRKDWLEENDPKDGTDCETPFDKWLYTMAPAGARHPLEIYAESYDQMSRTGDKRVNAHDVAVDIRLNMIPVTMPLPQRGDSDRVRMALRTALDHIDHMSAWIGRKSRGYSFESLGEDMEEMRSALDSMPPEPPREAIAALQSGQRQLDADGSEVGVSRQAVDEVLSYLNSPERESILTRIQDYAQGQVDCTMSDGGVGTGFRRAMFDVIALVDRIRLGVGQ